MTNKIKINSGLASIILLTCLFSGWETLLIVTVLMLLFCETDKKVKDIVIKVISFYAAISLMTWGWNLINQGITLIINSLESIIEVFNIYFGSKVLININAIQDYFGDPVIKLLEIVDAIIKYLLFFAKFSFIIAVLGNKELKENIIVKKINDYVTKIVNFINTFDYASQQQTSNTSVPSENIFPNPNSNFSNNNNHQNFY